MLSFLVLELPEFVKTLGSYKAKECYHAPLADGTAQVWTGGQGGLTNQFHYYNNKVNVSINLSSSSAHILVYEEDKTLVNKVFTSYDDIKDLLRHYA